MPATLRRFACALVTVKDLQGKRCAPDVSPKGRDAKRLDRRVAPASCFERCRRPRDHGGLPAGPRHLFRIGTTPMEEILPPLVSGIWTELSQGSSVCSNRHWPVVA